MALACFCSAVSGDGMSLARAAHSDFASPESSRHLDPIYFKISLCASFVPVSSTLPFFFSSLRMWATNVIYADTLRFFVAGLGDGGLDDGFGDLGDAGFVPGLPAPGHKAFLARAFHASFVI